MARSSRPPSGRAELFVIGQYLILQTFKVKKTLTTTGNRYHSGRFRRHRVDEGSIPAQKAGVVGLGLLANRWPIMSGV